MRLFAAGLTALTLGGCVMPMGMGDMGAPMTAGEAQAASASLQQSQALATAQASRPGDAAMTCAEIQAETMAAMKDPKFTQAMASMGARAQEQKAQLDAAMAGGKPVKPTGDAARAPLAMSADLETMMPMIMRGQRLQELAAAKNCPMPSGPPA